MNPLLDVFLWILNLYKWSLVIYVLISVLCQFGIINRYNSFVDMIQNSLGQIHEPILQKLRNFIPSFGNFDLSPLLIFIGVELLDGFLRSIIQYY